MHFALDSPPCIATQRLLVVNIFFCIDYCSVVLFSVFSTYVDVLILDEYL